jgi:hypothetical protein
MAILYLEKEKVEEEEPDGLLFFLYVESQTHRHLPMTKYNEQIRRQQCDYPNTCNYKNVITIVFAV